jgi:hypothetical protein
MDAYGSPGRHCLLKASSITWIGLVEQATVERFADEAGSLLGLSKNRAVATHDDSTTSIYLYLRFEPEISKRLDGDGRRRR